MLQAIRDRASGLIAYAIVILISIPFALWGINEYFGGGGKLIAAEVNGREIPVSVYSERLQQHKRYLQSVFGGRLPSQYTDDSLKGDVIQSLVRVELLREELDAAGYRVSDTVLFDYIRTLPIFSTDGQFDPERYAQILAAQRRPAPQFESEVRDELRRSLFEDGVARSSLVPASALDDFVSLQGQQREIAYFVIRGDEQATRDSIGDEEVDAYYQEHQAQFSSPERVKLAYLELGEQVLAERVDVTDASLEAFYQEQAELYVTPEQRRVRHILIKPDAKEGALEPNLGQLRERANEAMEKLRSGTDFAVVVSEYSGDALTVDKGGDLGWIARGELASEIDSAIFSLDANVISDPVQTHSGWEILEVLEIKEAQQKPFEQVRDQVELDYRQRAAETMFAELTEQLVTLTYEQSDSLDAAADAVGVPINTTDWITRNAGVGIASSPELRRVAFSEEVLQERRNSDLLEPTPGTVVVLRIAEHEPSSPKPKTAVVDEIKDILTGTKLRDESARLGEEALTRLRKGEALDRVATDHGADLERPGFITRKSDGVPAYMLNKVFALHRPTTDKPTFGGLVTPDAGFAVIALTATRPGEVSETARKEAMAKLGAIYGRSELEDVMRSLEERAKIRVFQENL